MTLQFQNGGSGYFNEDKTVFTAPIDVGTWGARVECHGKTAAEAYSLRSKILISTDAERGQRLEFSPRAAGLTNVDAATDASTFNMPNGYRLGGVMAQGKNGYWILHNDGYLDNHVYSTQIEAQCEAWKHVASCMKNDLTRITENAKRISDKYDL